MPRKLSPQKAEIAIRRGKALELRAAGLTYAQIAAQLDYSSDAAAHKDVDAALRSAVEIPAKEMLAEELNRVEKLLSGLWPDARRGDVLKVDRVVKLLELRAKYMGLFAPERFQAEVSTDDPSVLAAQIVEIADALVERANTDPG